LSILSGLPASELARAVQGKDARALVAVPGVGKKSADRILLELQDKLTFALSAGAGAVGSPAVSRSAGPVGQQVVEALTRLGFKPSEAEWAVSSLENSVENRSISEVFREALAVLRH
jgi:Holliday junction DNA helicase RuvA